MKHTLTTLLICLSLGVMGQSKRDTTHRTDTTYTLKGDRNLTILYNLLQAGFNGVATSDEFSVRQRKEYQQAFLHLDSLLKPQYIKWHPSKGVKK